VNGGINDVSAYHIAIANPFGAGGAAQIADQTTKQFETFVNPLLKELCARLPKAVVIVTGYFPIVSAQSDLALLAKLLNEFPERRLVHRVAAALGHLLPKPITRMLIGDEHQRMTAQCAAFLSTAHGLLRSVVAELTAGGSRVWFADAGLTDANAYGAPDALLWDGEDDPLHAERRSRFLTEGLLEGWNVGTPVASICHPNVGGAQKYVDAIVRCLEAAGFARQ
jgi:hypothetical protein